ncbi:MULTISPECIES: DUF4233 domain-containing protein [unclassified Microbacterium]|uniref:DUF4233 domain-containing protein n=1 Tax=unclassified Microbacterium TaxID=2609290 RepID=UPI00386A355E
MSPRIRRHRGARESLLSVILISESLVAFLGGLVVYGLRVLPDGIADWWGIVGGAAFAIILILTSGLLRHGWAVVLGAVLQGVLALAAFLVPALLIAAVVFGGMYVYATIKGGALDERNAALAAQAATNGD